MMKLPTQSRLELEAELRYIYDRVVSEKDPRRKIFFYSAATNATRRILSSNFDPELVCIDMVLEVSCGTISERVESILVENDPTIQLIDGFFDKLASAVKELADCVKSNKDTHKTLEKIAGLAYVTTRNGYYLHTKGLVDV